MQLGPHLSVSGGHVLRLSCAQLPLSRSDTCPGGETCSEPGSLRHLTEKVGGRAIENEIHGTVLYYVLYKAIESNVFEWKLVTSATKMQFCWCLRVVQICSYVLSALVKVFAQR